MAGSNLWAIKSHSTAVTPSYAPQSAQHGIFTRILPCHVVPSYHRQRLRRQQPICQSRKCFMQCTPGYHRQASSSNCMSTLTRQSTESEAQGDTHMIAAPSTTAADAGIGDVGELTESLSYF